MAKQTRTRRPTKSQSPAESMTLAETRKLLSGLTGKMVRGGPVDMVWLALSAEDDTACRGYQVCVVLEPHPPCPTDSPTERVVKMVCKMQSPQCDCIDEEELRRVLLDPSQGQWYFDDESPPYL